MIGFLVWAFLANDRSAAARFAGVIVGLGYGGFYSLRLARTGVYPTEDGVTVVNPLSTRRVRWELVQSFGIGRFGLYPRVGWVEEVNGTRLRIWGIQGPNPVTRPKPGQAERMIDELNDLLGQHRGRANVDPSS